MPTWLTKPPRGSPGASGPEQERAAPSTGQKSWDRQVQGKGVLGTHDGVWTGYYGWPGANWSRTQWPKAGCRWPSMLVGLAGAFSTQHYAMAWAWQLHGNTIPGNDARVRAGCCGSLGPSAGTLSGQMRWFHSLGIPTGP